jgi:hypothetical protein
MLLPILSAIPHASSALRFIAILPTLPKKINLLTKFLMFIIMLSPRSGSARNATATVLQVPGGGGDGGGDRGGCGPPTAPAGVVPTNNFGLTPAQVAPDQYILYIEAAGIKLWNAASATLPAKWEVDSEGLSRFNEHVVDHKMHSGWNAPGTSIMMVPDVDGVLRHLVHNYGQLTLEDVTPFVATFIGQETHQAQNNVQFYYSR